MQYASFIRFSKDCVAPSIVARLTRQLERLLVFSRSTFSFAPVSAAPKKGVGNSVANAFFFSQRIAPHRELKDHRVQQVVVGHLYEENRRAFRRESNRSPSARGGDICSLESVTAFSFVFFKSRKL